MFGFNRLIAFLDDRRKGADHAYKTAKIMPKSKRQKGKRRLGGHGRGRVYEDGYANIMKLMERGRVLTAEADARDLVRRIDRATGAAFRNRSR